MNEKLVRFGLALMIVGSVLSIMISLAKAQTIDQPNILPINATKAHNDGYQVARYLSTFAEIIRNCSLEPDGSLGQAQCNSFAADFSTHMKALYSNHTGIINHVLGIGP